MPVTSRFALDGSKLSGGFALTRTGPDSWILVKMRDAEARDGSDVTAERPESVRSGRTIAEVAGGDQQRGATI
jgi:hypothetical protein